MSKEEEESMTNDSTNNSTNYGLDPFQLIERGNGFESSSNYWSAAGCFGRASLLLKSQGDAIFASMSNHSSSSNNNISSNNSSKMRMKQVLAEGRSFMEQEKIGQLYHSQSLEYLYKARDCFLKAITLETKDDQTRQSQIIQPSSASQSQDIRTSEYVGDLKMQLPQEIFQPLIQLISPNEAIRRTRIFQQIYSTLPQPQPQKEEEETITITQKDQQTQTNIIQIQQQQENDDDDTLLDLPTVTLQQPQSPSNGENNNNNTNNNENGTVVVEDTSQLSLEERLARLDSSLPPRKSQSQQVKDRLNQLGVYIPDSSSSSQPLPPSMDEQDEVDFIIAQAKDEASFYHSNNDNQDNDDDEVNSILRKSGIRIDVHQYQTIDTNDNHDTQETVQDLLNQAQQMKKQATECETKESIETNTTKEEDEEEENEEKVVNQLIDAATYQIHQNNDKNNNKEENETMDTKEKNNNDAVETTTTTTTNDEEEKVVNKIIQDVTNDNDKTKVNDDDDLKDLPKLATTDDSSTVENTTVVDLDQSVANLLDRAKNLTVETNNNDTKQQQQQQESSIQQGSNEEKEEISQVEKMKETIKLLTAAQKLIDDATIFLDEDILHVDLQDELMSDDDDSDDNSEMEETNIISKKNNNNNDNNDNDNEMRKKGKASIRAAQECLQKLLDSWPN